MPSSHLKLWVWVLGLAASLLVAYLIYLPGLKGGFVLDDIPNLEPLGSYGHYETWDRLRLFVFSGNAGLSGRPLSLLSFLINDYAWPTSAYSYKYTNVLLHLLNGVLVCWTVVLLANEKRATQPGYIPSATVALLATAIWLFHPLNVSTVLYVVQRMAMLAAFFSLFGIIFYLKGRSTTQNNLILGYSLMSTGIVIGTGLGVLCKENAVLLPLYIIIMEYTVLATPKPQYWKAWALLFLGLPVLLLAGWHIWNFPNIIDGYTIRTFTMGERLLTESRILWQYLTLILLPRLSGTGVFYDDYPISHGLLSPPTTLISIIGLTVLLVVALHRRRMTPWFTFGILWFLAGHLLESSLIPLELFFEHRNYLPMVGPIVALAHYVTRAKRLRRFLAAASLVFLTLLAFTTWRNSIVWGSPIAHAELALLEHPYSIRAAQFSAQQWMRYGYPDKSRDVLLETVKKHPDNPTLHLQILYLHCFTGVAIEEYSIDTLLEELHNGMPGMFESRTLDKILKLQSQGKCLELKVEDLNRIASELYNNPAFKKSREYLPLVLLLTKFRINTENFSEAASYALKAYELSPSADKALLLASIYHRMGNWEEVERYVSKASRFGRYPFLRINVLEPDINRWRAFILQHKTSNILGPQGQFDR